MSYLLDTNICVFYLRGHLDLDNIIREKGLENIYISELTVFKLRYGAENSDHPKKSHKAVDKDFRFIPKLKMENWIKRKK